MDRLTDEHVKGIIEHRYENGHPNAAYYLAIEVLERREAERAVGDGSVGEVVGRAAHEAWRRWRIDNGYPDHVWEPDYLSVACERCDQSPVLHHDDMMPWKDLDEPKREKYIAFGMAGYAVGVAAARAEASAGEDAPNRQPCRRIGGCLHDAGLDYCCCDDGSCDEPTASGERDFCFICGHDALGHDAYHDRWGDKHAFLSIHAMGKRQAEERAEAAEAEAKRLEGMLDGLQAQLERNAETATRVQSVNEIAVPGMIELGRKADEYRKRLGAAEAERDQWKRTAQENGAEAMRQAEAAQAYRQDAADAEARERELREALREFLDADSGWDTCFARLEALARGAEEEG